jgi:membrane complex biogenesis BtpA family protein
MGEAARPATRPYKIVGVVHLPALPGTVRGGTAGDLPSLIDAVRRDAAAYAAGGVDALIVENFGDTPFARGAVGPYTVAAMTLATAAVRAESGLAVGVNVLRNDVLAAVAVAAAAGGAFVRANVYVGAAVTDQGLIEGRAEEVQALIRRLGANIAVWADVDVKHAAPLAHRPLGELAGDAVERGLAEAIIVSGRGTGQPVELDDLRAVREALPNATVYVGSGATPASLPDLLRYAHGAIVGTAAKVDGEVHNAVDPACVRALVRAVHESTERTSHRPPS